MDRAPFPTLAPEDDGIEPVNDNQNTYPRVLVISPCTFNYLNGGGVTFSNLFRDWPADKLANLHSSEEPEDHTVCRNFFRMGPEEIQSSLPGSSRKRGPQAAAPITVGQGTPPKNERRTFTQRLKATLSGNSGWPRRFHPSPELTRWLEAFRPEVIYTILGPIPFMEGVLEIQERFLAKLVVHHMDDWHPTAYTTGIFRGQRRKMLNLFSRIVEKADLRLTIGDAMAEEYSRRFARTYLPFQNTIDVEGFRKSMHSEPGLNGLLYFGSIYSFAQEQSIADTIAAFRQLESAENQYVMRVVAPAAQLAQLGEKIGVLPRNVIFVPMKNDPNQFGEEIAAATALLLPANFDPTSVSFLRYSMPTKLPGYMASGRPILMYGSPDLAQSKYAAKYGFALELTDRDPAALTEGVKAILHDQTLRARLAERALATAAANHDLRKVLRKFQESLKTLL